jgi:hypothetical protein
MNEVCLPTAAMVIKGLTPPGDEKSEYKLTSGVQNPLKNNGTYSIKIINRSKINH